MSDMENPQAAISARDAWVENDKMITWFIFPWQITLFLHTVWGSQAECKGIHPFFWLHGLCIGLNMRETKHPWPNNC